MKLIIQIPCLNEERTLPAVLADLPKQIDGIDVIETQIIDDGSTDKTVETAKALGVTHIISLPHHQGLAAAFKIGAECALDNGADILVNTDGDNQYCGADISLLVKTMLEEKADMVIGCRPIKEHTEFSPLKKVLQRAGSWVVRFASRTTVPDAASGFRAYSAKALLRMNIISTFSYCLETIIQAGILGMKICHVNIRVNPKTRESRLFSNIFQYIYKQAKTILQMFILYRSGTFFSFVSWLFMLPAIMLGVRFMWLLHEGSPGGNFWPSIILAGVLVVLSSISYLAGILAALLASQRKISEEIVYRLRCLDIGRKS